MKFLIGVRNKETSTILENGYPPGTYAFANVTKYDFANYTENTRGIIWVAEPSVSKSEMFPPYNEDGIFRLALLHEIGHTIGIGHINDHSVMTEHIFEWMALRNDPEWPVLKKVFPYLLKLDAVSLLIPYGRESTWAPKGEIKDFFESLTGQSFPDSLKMRLTITPT